MPLHKNGDSEGVFLKSAKLPEITIAETPS
jgi:hypothetical protein